MAEFYYDNLARNLPDVYQKHAEFKCSVCGTLWRSANRQCPKCGEKSFTVIKENTSNNYKILEVERAENGDLRDYLYGVYQCPKCKKTLPYGVKICPTCVDDEGKPIVGEIAKKCPTCGKILQHGESKCDIHDVDGITAHGINNILDIDNATGETLDMYGERFGQARGNATDAQYIAMIKSKIIRALCNGSYKNIIDAICYTFGCTPKDVLITEDETPLTVHVEKVPLDKIIKAGFSSQQAEAIIKRLLPVSVTIETLQFEGTFEFGETEGEYDVEAGFGETLDGDTGGYLGLLGSQESIGELPI